MTAGADPLGAPSSGQEPLGGAVVYLDTLPERYDSVVCLTYVGERPFMVRNLKRAWEFPGGHREDGEDLYATVRREAYEEAGATLGEVVVMGHYVLSGGHTTVVTHAQVADVGAPGEFETCVFERLPEDSELSWADGLYAHLIRVLGLPLRPA